jgi:hypothetical protein
MPEVPPVMKMVLPLSFMVLLPSNGSINAGRYSAARAGWWKAGRTWLCVPRRRLPKAGVVQRGNGDPFAAVEVDQHGVHQGADGQHDGRGDVFQRQAAIVQSSVAVPPQHGLDAHAFVAQLVVQWLR